MNDDRTMLVIGADGFVGRHVRDVVANAGLEVVTADRTGKLGTRCDLLDPASVASCLEGADPDLMINMAGAASVAASWERGKEALEVNATGVANLLEAIAARAPSAHVLCVSSAEVYGEPSGGRLPFHEGLSLSPVTPYGESKAAMEAVCDRFAGEQGLRVAVVRAFNLIGPGQSSAFAAAGFARQIAAAELTGAEVVELAVGNLAAARDFTDVRDAARAFVEISRAELTGVYNLCSGRAVKLEALVAELARETPLHLSIRQDSTLERPVDPSVVYGNPARLREAIGWTPEIPLSETAADLLDWWRSRLAAA
ncbi:MAG TPA: NAD-dependent epimerase/dehydratase family protein [Solirubrobacterales bacterium]